MKQPIGISGWWQLVEDAERWKGSDLGVRIIEGARVVVTIDGKPLKGLVAEPVVFQVEGRESMREAVELAVRRSRIFGSGFAAFGPSLTRLAVTAGDATVAVSRLRDLIAPPDRFDARCYADPVFVDHEGRYEPVQSPTACRSPLPRPVVPQAKREGKGGPRGARVVGCAVWPPARSGRASARRVRGSDGTVRALRGRGS